MWSRFFNQAKKYFTEDPQEKLKKMFSPDSKFSSQIIKGDQSVDVGTKILYLERAISVSDFKTFSGLLSKLYNDEIKTNVLLTVSLGAIHCTYFDDQALADEFALEETGENSVESLRESLKNHVKDWIKILEENISKEEIEKQKTARIKLEETLPEKKYLNDASQQFKKYFNLAENKSGDQWFNLFMGILLLKSCMALNTRYQQEEKEYGRGWKAKL